MFEKTMEGQLKRIFGLDKVSYDNPSDSQEQEGIFIQILGARSTIKDQRQLCKVNGRIRVFVQNEKMSYGFLAKRIAGATPADTKPYFFFDIEENAGTVMNVTERTASFVYLFDSQYNPERGSITSIDFDPEETDDE